MKSKMWALALSLVGAMPVYADQEGLRSLLTGIEHYQATFSQKVVDESGEVIQEAEGDIAMARPNRLRWTVSFPDESVLIADGQSVWSIDPFVEQVTVFSQVTTIDNNPMILLTTNDANEWNKFTVSAPISAGNQVKYQVSPKDTSGQIQQLTLSFEGELLAGLTFVDSQNQVSDIVFSDAVVDQALSPALFVPDYADTFTVDDQR